MKICEYGCGREATYQFKNGKWCCEDNTQKCPIMRKKLRNKKAFTYHHVKEIVENRGYVLLSNTYINANSKLKILCQCGNIFYPLFGNFNNSKSGCPKCATKRIKNKLKTKDKEIHKELQKYGYSWISGKYTNANTKINICCPNGHTYNIQFASFKSGYRCPICAGNYKKPEKEIKKIIENRNYKWISGRYKNISSELTFECPEGHNYTTKLSTFLEGCQCPICMGNAKLTLYVLKIKYPFFCKIEELREEPKTGEIQVHCKNHKCKNSKENGGWFTPTYNQLYNRISYIESSDSCNFYCSDECKNSCSIYGKSAATLIKLDKIKAGHSPEEQYTNEEYNTYRLEVLNRADYTCEYCGEKATYCHHIRPQKLEPFFSLDPDYGVACCQKCHYEYGHPTGTDCSTGNLAQRIC